MEKMNSHSDKNQDKVIQSNNFHQRENHEKDGINDKGEEKAIQGSLQSFISQSPRVRNAAQQQSMINNSPKMIAQRKRLDNLFGKIREVDSQINEGDQNAIQKKGSETGLPSALKSGIENISGLSMEDVKVNYNSPKPLDLNAHAYAQNSEIHLSPGQERHLPHEAWHIVQQKQGRVKSTTQAAGVSINDDNTLEREADLMGAKALSFKGQEDQKKSLDQNFPPIQKKASEAPLQRRIKFAYNTWLNGLQVNELNTKKYFNEYVRPEYSLANKALNGMNGLAEFDNLRADYLLYAKAEMACTAGTQQWATIVAPLNNLVGRINAALDYAKTTLNLKGIESYSNERSDSWSDAEDALKSMDNLASKSTLAPKAPEQKKQKDQQHPEIPGLAWTALNGKIPSALYALIRDIHTSWRLGQVMDERSQQSQASREKNPNEAGGLRSWHVNEQGQLPNISGLQRPAHADALHNHYNATSRHPYEKNNNTGSVGYAEYTGTGIQSDFHYSKIVLDYKTGFMYVTVSHYQLWDKKEDGSYDIKNKTAGSGTNSAWFYIDMNQ